MHIEEYSIYHCGNLEEWLGCADKAHGLTYTLMTDGESKGKYRLEAWNEESKTLYIYDTLINIEALKRVLDTF